MKLILSAFFIVFFALTPIAQNIHVALDGSDDTGNGTSENPFATIDYASQFALPGDTVFVHEGTYRNPGFGDGDIWKKTSLGNIKCNGTPDEWITFMPYPGDTVLLETDAKGLYIKGSYIIWEGFEMKGPGDQITMEEAVNAWGLYKDSLGVVHDLAQELGIDYNDPNLWGQYIEKPVLNNISKPAYYNSALLVALKTHHVVIGNNKLHDATASALRNQGGDYIIFKNNTVWSSTYWTSTGVGALTVAEVTVRPEGDTFEGVKNKIESNIVFNNANKLVSWNPHKDFIHWVIDEGSGIFLTRNNDTYDHGYILIADNLSYFNGASGIIVHKTDRVIVEHNTCYHNGTTNGESKAGGIGMNSTVDVTIRNNISWASADKSALYKQGGELINLIVEGNLLFNENGEQSLISGIPDEGYIEANPLLVDPDNGNLKLNGSSPAINNGVTGIYVTYDITGYPRNDGHPDIGAYEYHSSSISEENPVNSKINIFPNPASLLINCEVTNEPVEYEIIDLTGKVVLKGVSSPVNNISSINISELKPGLYILKAGKNSKTFVKR